MSTHAVLLQGFQNGLKYIKNDIKNVKDTFENIGISVDILNTNNAREIRTIIEEKCLSSFANDTIVVYYTGHGILKNNKLYLQVADTNNFFLDMLCVETIVDTLVHSSYSKVVLVLDCCNAETAKKSITTKDLERFHLMYSSRTLQKSYELDEYRLSALLCYFVNLFVF